MEESWKASECMKILLKKRRKKEKKTIAWRIINEMKYK